MIGYADPDTSHANPSVDPGHGKRKFLADYKRVQGYTCSSWHQMPSPLVAGCFALPLTDDLSRFGVIDGGRSARYGVKEPFERVRLLEALGVVWAEIFSHHPSNTGVEMMPLAGKSILRKRRGNHRLIDATLCPPLPVSARYSH